MAEQTFDPRFDPAFQRGYEPPAQAAPAAPIAGEAASTSAETATLDTAQADAHDDHLATAAQVRRGVNPYVVILWVIGVIFVLGGAAALFLSYFWLLTTASAAPSQNTAAQTLYLFSTAFGVPAITVGLATIAGLIFFSAWRAWRRHNGLSS